MQSCIYRGQVRHRRFVPVEHEFEYSLFMLYLDLDELSHVFEPYWLWSARRPALARFRREDHYGDRCQPLGDAIRELVATRTGRRPAGPIRLLTNLRYFGYGFNPVSFYYCYEPSGQRVETIVAEVNNTPWGEQYCYVLPEAMNESINSGKQFRLSKAFHVSPFMPMDIDYEWHLTEPAERLTVHMKNLRESEALFDATLRLTREPITHANLARALLRHPFVTGKVISAIHYQALRLWLKRTPLHTHPAKLRSTPQRGA